jgi:hypothetical protein
MLSTGLGVLRMAWHRIASDQPLGMRANPRLAAAQAYFDQHFDQLLEDFPGEYVAIIDDTVVSHDRDLAKVTKDVYTQYKQRPIFINKVEQPEEIALPSPTLSWPNR